eukprot:TRINITY_DN9721_c0_g2_i2.p1 TRINITY_DN9721_c0_g2~~TRINITY_DN9721_c0_g2_i2.p1  ORF type:complete len:243 (-),score=37.08 TRINITY_DN9721_c0_g2_i2:30-758(-)
MFQIFNCTGPGGTLSADPSVSCFTQKWKTMVVFDSCFMFLYFIILPAFVLKKYRECNGDPRSIEFMRYFSPLITPYRVGCDGFEIFRLAFKLSFVIVRDVLPSQNQLFKTTVLAIVFTFQTWLEGHLQPYPEIFTNDMSLLWSLNCLLVLLSQFIFSSDLVTDVEKKVFGILFTVLVICLCCCIVLQTVFAAIQSVRHQPPSPVQINNDLNSSQEPTCPSGQVVPKSVIGAPSATEELEIPM